MNADAYILNGNKLSEERLVSFLSLHFLKQCLVVIEIVKVRNGTSSPTLAQWQQDPKIKGLIPLRNEIDLGLCLNAILSTKASGM